MDTSPSAPRLCYSFQHYQHWSSSGSDDSDLSYMSSPGTLSPVPSVDSSLSPASSASFSYVQQCQNTESTPKAATKTGGYPDRNLLECASSSTGPGKRIKTARGGTRGPCRVARVRSKQRESASEKEKLRMRDLTKALNHLRTYLPPSVAPAGQTLTKIETLRLAIRYISDLSEQLGLSDEVLERWSDRRRREEEEEKGDDCCSSSEISSPDILNGSGGGFQCGATAVGCVWTQSQGLGLDTSQYHHHQSQPAFSGSCGFGADLFQYSGQYSLQETEADVFDSNMESGDLLLPQATQPISCQIYGKDFCSPLAPRDYWG